MASRANWAQMTVSSGGTVSITLAAISNTPTFAAKHGSGSTTIDYVIYDPTSGMYEAGTGSYNGTTHVLSSRTVTESYTGGVFGTSAINVALTAKVFNAPTIQSVVDLTSAQTLTTKTLSAPVLSGSVTGTYTLNAPTISGGAWTGGTDLAVADGGTGASTAADARTNLGLGSVATQAADAVAITGGSIAGITDLAIADGGTGASTAADARTNLELGSAALEDASSFADVDHVHASPSEVGILGMDTATLGQIPIINADGELEVGTATLASFASNAFTGATRTVIVRNVAGDAWETKTLQELVALLGKDKIALPFAIPESDGAFPICPYVPQGAVGTVTACYVLTQAGTQRINIKIGSTSITGLSAVDATTTRSAWTATAANSLTLGAQLNGVVSLSSSASRGMGVLLVTTAVP